MPEAHCSRLESIHARTLNRWSAAQCAKLKFDPDPTSWPVLFQYHGWIGSTLTIIKACCSSMPLSQVTNDSDSPGKEHKVKLAAVIVSEEAGQLEGIESAATVEHVHDISFRREYGSGEVFDIRNHI